MNSLQPEDIRNRLLVARLPAMPQVLLKLMALCQSPDSGLPELAELLANDVALSSRVLTVASSAAYGRSGRNLDLMQALSVLGLELTRTLVIGESVRQTFNSFAHSSATDLRLFWKHSLTVAVLARDIARQSGYPRAEEAYLAGLLHDVGRLALMAAAPESYQFNFQASDGEGLCGLEVRALGIAHPEAGAWLIERWQMDSFLADSVLYHHEPLADVQGAHLLVRIVHLADTLCDLTEPDDASGGDAAPWPPQPGALCGLEDGVIRTLVLQAGARVQNMAQSLGIDIAPAPPAAQVAAAPPPVAAPGSVQQRLTLEMRNRALLGELAQVFARHTHPAALMDSVRDQAQLIFDLAQACLFRVSTDGTALQCASLGGPAQRLRDFSLELRFNPELHRAVSRRQQVFFCQEQRQLGLAERQLLRALDAPCLLALPLCSRSGCLGVLLAGLPTWRLAELRPQASFLLAFGALAAQALERLDADATRMQRSLDGLAQEHQQLARQAVHEANNPLGIVRNYLGVVEDKLARQESVSAELARVGEEIDRVGVILREFAQNAPGPAPAPLDINLLLRDLANMFRDSRFLPPTLRIVTSLPDEPSLVMAVGDTLKQIFINLIKNAVEALPRGGQIDLLNLGRSVHGGVEYLAVAVQDNGPGLPKAVLERLFAPVHSVKSGDNRGLGLSIVHGLVNKLGGHIRCSSSAQGARFEILLPLARQTAVRP